MLAELAALPLSMHIGLAFVLGLLFGSFLNVVIFRFPHLLKYQWSAQSHEWLHETEYHAPKPAGINHPASHCYSCKTPLKPWHNVPLLSFLWLRGKCAYCRTPISLRYPLVELLTAILSACVVYRFGWSIEAGLGLILTWVMIALSGIDIDHQLLPDDIVLPVLWLGLGLSLAPVFANSTDAIIGAIAGYLVFWIVFQVFKRLTGKEGMGHGDFKLLALFGAWFGWQYLAQIILISTLVGSVIGISLILLKINSRDKTIPFGPYIALAGWIAMLWGNKINALYLDYAGL